MLIIFSGSILAFLVMQAIRVAAAAPDAALLKQYEQLSRAEKD